MNTIFSYANITWQRIFILLAVCLLYQSLQAQQANQALKTADAYFASGEYFTAAVLYGQILQPASGQQGSAFPLNAKRKRTTLTMKPNMLSTILFKQAESYRHSHNWEAAAIAYNNCAANNSEHRIEALFWSAICHRSLGLFDVAENMLQSLLNESQISSGYKRLVAEERQRLVYIRKQLSMPDAVLFNVQKVKLPFSDDQGAFAPAHITGNQYIISSTATDSSKVKGVSPYHGRLYIATIIHSNLDEMKSLLLPSAGDFDHQGAASISSNGDHLYYTQWKLEKGKATSSIYFAIKRNGRWSPPQQVSSLNRKGYNSKQPFYSADGAYLYFASDRPGGSGKFDIWYAPLKSDGSTGEPINAGQVINTEGDEVAPFYHSSSGTLVFASNFLQGMGGYDLFSSKRSNTSWALPQNMGYPVNSVKDDMYFFARENAPLLGDALISSDRASGCCLQTYSVTKATKKKILSGLVRDRLDSTVIPGAHIILKNNTGTRKEVNTDADGKYELQVEDSVSSLLVIKAPYKEVITPLLLKKIDDDNVLTEQWVNQDIYLDHVEMIKAEDVVTVYFDFDQSMLKPETISKLDSICKTLLQFPSATIDVSGYSDVSGSQQYNKKLSDKRAKACSDYLISKGIARSRIRFESFGSCCPVEMELINRRDNIDTRGLNRRALIHVRK